MHDSVSAFAASSPASSPSTATPWADAQHRGERHVQFLALIAEQLHPAQAELVRLVDGVEARKHRVRNDRRVEQEPGFQALAAASLTRLFLKEAQTRLG